MLCCRSLLLFHFWPLLLSFLEAVLFRFCVLHYAHLQGDEAADDSRPRATWICLSAKLVCVLFKTTLKHSANWPRPIRSRISKSASFARPPLLVVSSVDIWRGGRLKTAAVCRHLIAVANCQRRLTRASIARKSSVFRKPRSSTSTVVALAVATIVCVARRRRRHRRNGYCRARAALATVGAAAKCQNKKFGWLRRLRIVARALLVDHRKMQRKLFEHRQAPFWPRQQKRRRTYASNRLDKTCDGARQHRRWRRRRQRQQQQRRR